MAKIVINKKNVKRFYKANEKALGKTLEALKTQIAIDEVTPKDTGALEESCMAFQNGLSGGLSWNTPYARKVFYHPEFNFKKHKNKNAQGRWTDPYIYGDKLNWLVNAHAKFLKDEAGDLIK